MKSLRLKKEHRSKEVERKNPSGWPLPCEGLIQAGRKCISWPTVKHANSYTIPIHKTKQHKYNMVWLKHESINNWLRWHHHLGCTRSESPPHSCQQLCPLYGIHPESRSHIGRFEHPLSNKPSSTLKTSENAARYNQWRIQRRKSGHASHPVWLYMCEILGT